MDNVKTDLMESDGIHLCDAGYDLMTNNWFKTLKSKVGQNGNRFFKYLTAASPCDARILCLQQFA